MPFRLRLTAAQNSIDPLTHYWFKAAKNDYRRLCDNEPWIKGLRIAPVPGRVCHECGELRFTDREIGRHAFSLTHSLKGVFAPTAEDVVYLPKGMRDSNHDEPELIMGHITLSAFALFCIGGQSQRKAIASGKGGGDPYAWQRGLFRRTHWKNGDLQSLIHGTPQIRLEKTDLEREAIKADCEKLKGHYIAAWKREQASFFKLYGLDVQINGVDLRVHLNVGMRSAVGDRVLKVWLGKKPMPIRLFKVYSYLFQIIREHESWPGHWHPGIWNVREGTLPLLLPDALLGDAKETVQGAILDLVRLRNQQPTQSALKSI